MTRKTYTTLGLAIILSSTADAQQNDRTLRPIDQATLQPVATTHSDVRPAESGARGGGGTVIWSEDFSNGLAGNNPSGAWTTDGPHGNIWRVNSNAPVGAYTTAAERIQSTTFANGFAKFASDSANCTWNGTTPTALPVAEFTDWEGSLVSPVIDLSATPLVEIEFQQRSRWCCNDSPFFLEISSDGGQTWPTVLLANAGLPINQGAPGTGTGPTVTETRRFTLAAAIAEDPSNVRFRFHHNSESSTSHYHWQVDDIKILNLPDYEMQMNYGYTSTTGLGEEYGRIPVTQLPATMNVGAEIFNYGGQEQTNVVVTCSVTNAGGTEVFSNTANVGALASGATVVTDEDVTLPALPPGLYTATFTVSSDQIDQDVNPADNSRVRTFEVTNFIYSLDNLGNHPPGLQTTTQVGTASFTDNPEGVKLLNMYFINAPMTVTGMELQLGNASRAGGTIVISILDTVDVLSTPSVVNQPVDGIESDPYTLTTANIAAGRVTIPFPEPVELGVNAYYAVATISGSGTNDVTNDAEVYILDDTTVPQPGLASALWIPFDPPANQNFYGGNGTAWAIRLTSDPNISVGELNELPGVSMYPNPTNGILYINATRNEKYTVDVHNLLGELVMNTNFTNSTTLDLAPLADGVYSVRISNGDRSTVQRVTLN